MQFHIRAFDLLLSTLFSVQVNIKPFSNKYICNTLIFLVCYTLNQTLILSSNNR